MARWPEHERARLLSRRPTGLVVNAVTPTAIRLAPSLLVTDAQIEANQANALQSTGPRTPAAGCTRRI